MKRILALALACLMVFSLAACGNQDANPSPTEAPQPSSAPAASGIYTPGTYTGEGQGFGGAVKVTITVDANSITDVTIAGDSETPEIGGAALEELAEQVKTAQGADIDGVSGASLTSAGVKEAVADAIAQAKGESSSDAAGELSFTAGTYTGTAAGYNGPVSLNVTFSDSAVTAVEIDSEGETGHVGTPAYDIMFADIVAANGSGVDAVSGATFTSRAIKEAVNDAAEQAGVSDLAAFKKNTVVHEAQAPIDITVDVVVVGAGGAGMGAAAQAAQNGDTVLVIEKNADIGGNTLVSGGAYQSVMPYLCWDAADPDATTGEYRGQTYDKVKAGGGSVETLKIIAEWSEEPFDGDYYKDHEYEAGDIAELSKHGVHAEFLPTLQELKKEIKAYLDWAQPKLDSGLAENQLTLFSTINLHVFQTYYGGLRQSNDKSEWIYGDVELVKQFIEDGQDLKPWLQDQGALFNDGAQTTLIGALWWRENAFSGGDMDGDGSMDIPAQYGTYFATTKKTVEESSSDNQIMTRTTAENLIVEDGAVVGVTGTMYDGTPVTAHANKGVILATGGYAANISKVMETNKYWDTKFITSSTKTTNRNSMQGDGIRMGEEAGAATVGMGWTQLMPIAWIDNGNLSFGAGNYAAYINPTTGKRFVNEAAERDVLSQGELENGIEINGTQGVFLEFSNAETVVGYPYPYDTYVAPGVEEGATTGKDQIDNRVYFCTNTDELQAVLDEFGMTADPAVIYETLEAYDRAVMAGEEPPEVKKENPTKLIGTAEVDANGNYIADTYKLEGELIRIRVMAPSTHHTMGGLSIDTERHVLDADGNIIKGLYAAGEVTGGIHGGNRLGGNAIVEIFVSGRTAANAVNADN
ncbi:MAG: FAD-dependent oxidoreductase [Ruminococcus flavefaciens]|nr:FAD-dependent oxidoreductase [Ruminococcus flavefaciens]